MSSGRPTQALGVTLVEVLVAMLVLALGALSALSLQLSARHQRVDAGQRLMAASLARDLLERMRGNAHPQALQLYVQHSPHRRRPPSARPLPACTGAGACSPAALVAHDLWQWWRFLDDGGETLATAEGRVAAAGLDRATACILGPATGGSGHYEISIAWHARLALPEREDAPCGRGATDAQGQLLYGTQGEFRRVLSLRAYIAAQ